MPALNPELRLRIARLNDGVRTYQQIADEVGRSRTYVQELCREMGLPRPPKDQTNVRQRTPEALATIDAIRQLSDGVLTSKEIAAATGTTAKYVQAIALEFGLPRLSQGAQPGEDNHAFQTGRRIDHDGYVLVSTPPGHPTARVRKDRNYGLMFEHRSVMEQQLGRHLLPGEVVDHRDGLHLHNHPDNLRVFASNADHLRATISEQVPAWSRDGLANLRAADGQREVMTPVDSYRLERKRGDVRLRQILLAWLSLGEGSPYLLGTTHWLERAGIVDLSRTSLELHLLRLSQRFEQARAG